MGAHLFTGAMIYTIAVQIGTIMSRKADRLQWWMAGNQKIF
jgi:hypothetical protein